MQPSAEASSVFFVEPCGSPLLWLAIAGDGSAAALFDDAGASLLSIVSTLSLTLDPICGCVPTVTLAEPDFSATLLPSAPGFSLATGRWLMGRGGSNSQCAPSYPPHRSSEIAKKYANGGRIEDPTKAEAQKQNPLLHLCSALPISLSYGEDTRSSLRRPQSGRSKRTTDVRLPRAPFSRR
jgi:hypothetical protein